MSFPVDYALIPMTRRSPSRPRLRPCDSSFEQPAPTNSRRAALVRFASATPMTDQPSDESSARDPSSFPCHHTAIQTSNITTAILFYTSLFHFTVACKFRAGPARAAWLESSQGTSRLELVEVPPYLWPALPTANDATSDAVADSPPPPVRRRALDPIANPTLLGYNHLALDVTAHVQSFTAQTLASDTRGTENAATNSATPTNAPGTPTALASWMEHALQAKSRALFQKTIRVAVSPRQQMIGNAIYELAFVYDADGCLVELLNRIATLPQAVTSGWEPWNGTDFLGDVSNTTHGG